MSKVNPSGELQETFLRAACAVALISAVTGYKYNPKVGEGRLKGCDARRQEGRQRAQCGDMECLKLTMGCDFHLPPFAGMYRAPDDGQRLVPAPVALQPRRRALHVCQWGEWRGLIRTSVVAATAHDDMCTCLLLPD